MILNKNKISTIYLDMDDVCCNLRKEILTFLKAPLDFQPQGWGLFHEVLFGYPDEAELKRKEFFSTFTKQQWGDLEPTDEFPALLEWAHSLGEVAFLTACPPYGVGEAAKGKRLWVEKHAPHVPLIISSEKHSFSETGAILIDDKISNCFNFNKGLGLALLWEQSYNKHCKDLKFFDKNVLFKE